MIITDFEKDPLGKQQTFFSTEWESYEACLGELEALFYALLVQEVCSKEELHLTIDNASNYFMENKHDFS